MYRTLEEVLQVPSTCQKMGDPCPRCTAYEVFKLYQTTERLAAMRKDKK